jgi:hypothetical protein
MNHYGSSVLLRLRSKMLMSNEKKLYFLDFFVKNNVDVAILNKVT